MSGVQISAEDTEKQELVVAALTEERDQLRMDLQENIDMVNFHPSTRQNVFISISAFFISFFVQDHALIAHSVIVVKTDD